MVASEVRIGKTIDVTSRSSLAWMLLFLLLPWQEEEVEEEGFQND